MTADTGPRLPLDPAAWARVARAVIDTPYPWVPGHLVLGPDDTDVEPTTLHPAFHGSLDWHSCVHMLWSLHTLVDRYGDRLGADERAAAVATLEARLRPEHLAVEVAYLQARPGFERPYGWAWAAQLAAATTHSGLPESRSWAAALQPLGDLIAELVLDYLPRQVLPVRHGKHQNDAFALSLLIDAYQRLERPDVVSACRSRALDWFADDQDAPTGWEPGGTDFLSPALTEAELMVRVLPSEQAGAWLAGFLPGLGAGRHTHLLAVPQVSDPSDGQFAHLLGLALSRAWQLRALAPFLDDAAGAVRAGAAQQEQAVLTHITDGDFMATHWLVSFALLAAGHGPGQT